MLEIAEDEQDHWLSSHARTSSMLIKKHELKCAKVSGKEKLPAWEMKWDRCQSMGSDLSFFDAKDNPKMHALKWDRRNKE